MNSIRRKLCLSLVSVLALVLLAGGAAVYLSTQIALQQDLDSRLGAAAERAVAAMRSHIEAGQIEAVQLGRPTQAIEVDLSGEAGLFAEAWSPDGSVLARSTSLAGADLSVGTDRSSPFQIQLPNHPFGRGLATNSALTAF